MHIWLVIGVLCVGYSSALETDLKIEKEWRATLQRNLEQEKEKTTRQQQELQQLREVKRVRVSNLSCMVH